MESPTVLADPPAVRPLAVVYRPLASLVPDPRNARVHPKRQIEQIKASMGLLGIQVPERM